MFEYYSDDGFLHIAGTFYGSLDYVDTVQAQVELIFSSSK